MSLTWVTGAFALSRTPASLLDWHQVAVGGDVVVAEEIVRGATKDTATLHGGERVLS